MQGEHRGTEQLAAGEQIVVQRCAKRDYHRQQQRMIGRFLAAQAPNQGIGPGDRRHRDQARDPILVEIGRRGLRGDDVKSEPNDDEAHRKQFVAPFAPARQAQQCQRHHRGEAAARCVVDEAEPEAHLNRHRLDQEIRAAHHPERRRQRQQSQQAVRTAQPQDAEQQRDQARHRGADPGQRVRKEKLPLVEQRHVGERAHFDARHAMRSGAVRGLDQKDVFALHQQRRVDRQQMRAAPAHIVLRIRRANRADKVAVDTDAATVGGVAQQDRPRFIRCRGKSEFSAQGDALQARVLPRHPAQRQRERGPFGIQRRRRAGHRVGPFDALDCLGVRARYRRRQNRHAERKLPETGCSSGRPHHDLAPGAFSRIEQSGPQPR